MRLAACLLAFCLAHAAHAAPGAMEAPRVEAVGLRSVAGWLREHGAAGFLGGDVADAIGIARRADEEALPARQRGFRNDEVLRVAQISADAERDFVLFMVQQPGEVFFYFSTVREGLKKAFVSIPERNVVAPLEPLEAQRNFRAELRYWEDKAATR